MILKGNQRGNGRELANHLMHGKENEHIELHELRGFAAEDLHGAMQESEAIAKGTRCKNHLFSLSLNPPQDEQVSVETFELAISRIEGELGREGQPLNCLLSFICGEGANAVAPRPAPFELLSKVFGHRCPQLRVIHVCHLLLLIDALSAACEVPGQPASRCGTSCA